MNNKCKRIPDEIKDKCNRGAESITIKDPKWNQDAKLINREGQEVSTEWDCNKIKRECQDDSRN